MHQTQRCQGTAKIACMAPSNHGNLPMRLQHVQVLYCRPMASESAEGGTATHSGAPVAALPAPFSRFLGPETAPYLRAWDRRVELLEL